MRKIFFDTSENASDSFDIHLGRKLRSFRLRANWTLMDLSKRLGISHQQVHKYEQAQSKISAGMLYRIASIFSTSPSTFFEGYQDVKKKAGTSLGQSDLIVLQKKEKMNLLVIEDDPSDEFFLRKALESARQNFEIYCIHDGEEALHYLKGRFSASVPFSRPHIILLDLNLPKLDGLSLLRLIKQDRDIQHIPVLILTNSLNKQEMLSAYKCFAGGYIVKPFDPDLFKKNLHTTLTYWSESVVLPDE